MNTLRKEKELLNQLRLGSEQAFEKIYYHYSKRLFGNIFKLVKSKSSAQEILQVVFLKIWEKRESIDPEKSFRSYLFMIAENKVFDFFRKATREKKLQAQLLAVATEHYEHIEELLFKKENALIINKAIDLLPPQRQKVFRLCKIEGKSYEEVSQILGISTSTISDHIVKSGRIVREFLFNNLNLLLILLCLIIR